MTARKNHRGGAGMTPRRRLAVLSSLALLAMAAPGVAQTVDEYPNRPIRIIVPQAAGSGVDLQARVLAQKMGELWGQQGIVENRPGANAIVGMESAAKAQPDGYTLIYAPVSAVTTNSFIYKKLPYDTLRDFAPITQLLAGQIPLAFTTTAGATDLVQSGKLNLLATFGEARDEQFPDTPTVVESGYPTVVVVGWSGLLAPAGVPPQIIKRLHSGLVRALAMPDVKDAISRQG